VFETSDRGRKDAMKDEKFMGNWASIVWISKERVRNDQFWWALQHESFLSKVEKKAGRLFSFFK